jgi:hypothetical protein
MANGDFDVKIHFKTAIPGGGYTDAGAAKNQKTLVIGELTGTYVASGYVVKPQDFGLDVIDHISFTCELINAVAGTAAEPKYAFRDVTNGTIFHMDLDNQEATAGQATVATFFAVGDGAAAPELT